MRVGLDAVRNWLLLGGAIPEFRAKYQMLKG
jgi:hypothetical protein